MTDSARKPPRRPDPSTYLQAGLPLPWLDQTGWWQDGHRFGTIDDVIAELEQPPTEHPRTISIERAEGEPAAIVWFPAHHYLSTPPRRGWGHWVTLDRQISPSGAPRFTLGERVSPDQFPRKHRSLPPSGKVKIVTIDTTVLDVGLDPAKFRPNEALIVSAALALDMQAAMSFKTGRNVLGTSYGPGWEESTVAPLDQNVLKTYEMLCSDAPDPNPLFRQELTRTDLVCAATSIWFKAPLYTTRPWMYEGTGKKVRTIQYGEIRNKKALPESGEAAD